MNWRKLLARGLVALLVLAFVVISVRITPVPWWFIPSAMAAGCFVAWLLTEWIPDNWNDK